MPTELLFYFLAINRNVDKEKSRLKDFHTVLIICGLQKTSHFCITRENNSYTPGFATKYKVFFILRILKVTLLIIRDYTHSPS